MKQLTVCLCMLILSGCLSVVRFSMPHGPTCTFKVDQDFEVVHVVTNTWCCYPTIWMRCEVTRAQFDPDNTKAHWYNWIPLTAIWLAVPLDAAVDTVLLPWDYWYFNNR